MIKAAKEEVLDETGYDTNNHKRVLTFYPQDGISNQVAHIVFCKAGKKVSDFDHGEIKEVKWFSKSEIKKMIEKNIIKDGYTLIALMFYLNSLNN